MSNIIQFPGSASNGPSGSEGACDDASLLNKAQVKLALARTVPEHMEIYLEIVEHGLQEFKKIQPQGHDDRMTDWRSNRRPILIKVARKFQSAGLVLNEDMAYEGPFITGSVSCPEIIWDNPRKPQITFIWPDESRLKFEYAEALCAVNFFMWWQNFQLPVLGPGKSTSRILQKGDAGYDEYMSAKAQDQKDGKEPS